MTGSQPTINPSLANESCASPRWFDRFDIQMAVLLLLTFLVNRAGVGVPTGNETVYLLYFYKAWHPSFLSADWTFQEPTAGHAFFNLATGWLTRLFSLETAGWVARLICWFGSFFALLRLGRHCKIAPWAVFAGILVWLGYRQSILTTDWIVGSYEAKCLGYICLLLALDFAARERFAVAGPLAGLAFSFHSAVGMWGGAALGLAILSQFRFKQAMVFAAGTILLSLPGLISSWNLIFGSHSISFDEAKFLVTVQLPYCLDPAVMSKPAMVTMFGLLLPAFWHARVFRADRQIQLLFRFELVSAAFFAFGIGARIFGRFDLVKLYSMRVFAVLGILLAMWQLAGLMNWYCTRPDPRPRKISRVLTTIVVLLISLVSIIRVGQLARQRYQQWRAPEDDFDIAARWVADHTPHDATVIAPPWKRCAFYWPKRNLIACWHAPRYDALTEWKQRIELLVGPLPDSGQWMTDELDEARHDFYLHRPQTEMAALAQRFNAGYLITTAEYAWPIVYRTETYRVYAMPAARR